MWRDYRLVNMWHNSLLPLFTGLVSVIPSDVPSIFIKGVYTNCPRPPFLPTGIEVQSQRYTNHAREIKIPGILSASPRTPSDIVDLANWAYRYGYRVRAIGGNHNFSPFLVSPTDDGIPCPKIILVYTKYYLTSMRFNPIDESGLASVTCEPGVKLLKLLEFLEDKGYGVFASPTIGSITVGGMLATGTHGTGIPGSLDKKSAGHTYGTLSNMIINMTIVAWDQFTNSYQLKHIHRSEKEAKAFLVHLGRTFVTSVTLRVGKNQNLRTRSDFFVPVKEVYANPKEITSKGTNTLSSYANSFGRVDFLNLPTSEFVWIMKWHAEETKPQGSRLVLYPFNYYFMNYTPPILDYIADFFLSRFPSIHSLIGTFGPIGIWLAATFTFSTDFWGLSKNHLLYGSEFTPHISVTSFTCLTSRANLQQVSWLFMKNYNQLEKEYGREHLYETVGSDIRITGIDDPVDVGVKGAEAPTLSAAAPLMEHPEYDTVVWMDFGTFQSIPKRHEFYTRLQTALYRDVHQKFGIMRPEWSKDWALTSQGPFSNRTLTHHYFPKAFSNTSYNGWTWAISVFNRNDPHKVFSNDFLDYLLV